MFTKQNHIHDWVYFEYKVTKNMEICDLNFLFSCFHLHNFQIDRIMQKIDESLLKIVYSLLIKIVSDCENNFM